MTKQEENVPLYLNLDFNKLDVTTARKLASVVLEGAKVPHGDMSIPSKLAESGVFFISKWQRSALGTMSLIYKYGQSDLSIVLGVQRGTLSVPQGYMEVRLPKTDLTGLEEQGASRLHSKTLEPVSADYTILHAAVREILEETGIKIDPSELWLIGITNDFNSNPHCVAAQYMVKVDNKIGELSVLDDEFADDDLTQPMWYKVSDIIYDVTKDQYFFKQIPNIPLDNSTVEIINLGLNELNLPSLLVTSEVGILKELENVAVEGAEIIDKKQYKKYADYIEKVSNVMKNYKVFTESSSIKITPELHEKFISITKLQNQIMIEEYHRNIEENLRLEQYIKSNVELIQLYDDILKDNPNPNLLGEDNIFEINSDL